MLELFNILMLTFTENCTTFDQLKEEIDSYIEYYNNFRYRWELKKMAPNEYYQYMMTGKIPY